MRAPRLAPLARLLGLWLVVAAVAAPLVPWRWPRRRYAVFDYTGPQHGIAPACRWMAGSWPQRAGVKLGYGPLLSLLRDVHPTQATARLLLPVVPRGT